MHYVCKEDGTVLGLFRELEDSLDFSAVFKRIPTKIRVVILVTEEIEDLFKQRKAK